MRLNQTMFSPLLLGSLLVLGACTVGDTGAGDNDGTTTPDAADGTTPDGTIASSFTAAVTPATQTSELYTFGATVADPKQELLNAKNRFVVSLTSDGFAGNVNMSVTGLGTGWTGTFDPAVVTLAAGATATTTLRIDITSDGEAATKALSILATGPDGAVTTAASMTAANIVTVGDQVLPFPEVTIKLGTEFRIRNDGTVMHIIHGAGSVPHEDIGGGGHAPGAFYAPAINAAADGTWGGHDFGVDPAGGAGNYQVVHVVN